MGSAAMARWKGMKPYDASPISFGKIQRIEAAFSCLIYWESKNVKTEINIGIEHVEFIIIQVMYDLVTRVGKYISTTATYILLVVYSLIEGKIN